jgi:hypothetical protein
MRMPPDPTDQIKQALSHAWELAQEAEDRYRLADYNDAVAAAAVAEAWARVSQALV